MDIKTIYSLTRIDSLNSPREYIDVRGAPLKQPFTKPKRKRTYIEEIQKNGKLVPGPGMYNPNPEDNKTSSKRDKKLDFEKESKKPSGRYIQKFLKDKSKVPPVGKYNTEVDHTEQVIKRCKIFGDKVRKEAPVFKGTQFDDTQIDCIKVGPGIYNPDKAFGHKKQFRAPQGDHLASKNDDYPDPKEDKKKASLAKSQSLPKLPGSQSYKPIHQNYETFDKKASIQSISSVKTFTKGKRSSFSTAVGPGPKYSLISQWSPKTQGRNGKNFFKSVSSPRHQGVYN